MISTKVLLRTDKQAKNGKSPVYIRISKSRQSVYIGTGIKLEETEWDFDRETVKTSYKEHLRVNALIRSKISDVLKIAYDYELHQKPYTAAMVKDQLSNGSNESLIAYARKWIADRKERGEITHGTYLKYSGIIDKLQDHLGNKIAIAQFNIDLLRSFETYLQKKVNNHKNTVSSNFSFLRALANALIKDDLMELNEYPFKKFRLSYVETKRKYLTPEQLKEFEYLILKTDSKLSECRDIFLFCNQTGLRIGDALRLKKENFSGTHLAYKAQKTKTFITLPCTDKAKVLLEKYLVDKVGCDYIFNFLTPLNQVKEEDALREQKCATALINKNLGIMSDRIGLGFRVSTHFARHSMATNALIDGLSLEEIKAILHHKDLKTTQLYAQSTNQFLDNAISKLNS